MQSDWLRTFWPIFQEHLCPDLCRNTANNINFHYRTNSVKINDQMFQKTLFLARFCPILPILGAKNFFAEIRLCHAQFHIGFYQHTEI